MIRFARPLLLIAVSCLVVAVPLGAGETLIIPMIHKTGDEGFFAALVRLPENVPEGSLLYSCTVEKGDLYMVSAFPPGEQGSDRPAKPGPPEKRAVMIAGRFGNPGPARVSIVARPASDPPGSGGFPFVADLEIPKDMPNNVEAMQTWAFHWQRRLGASALRGTDPFLTYWRLVASRRYQIGRLETNIPRQINPEPPDLFSVFTGHAAIEESLQLESLGERLRPPVQVRRPDSGQRPAEPPPAKPRPMSSLSGPTVRSHPFGEMLPGRVPSVPELSRFIPEDQYAVFFSDINREIELADIMEEWGGNLLREIEASARDFRVREKIARQLCLETGLLTRLFGDRVIGAMAFTGGDPFFKEGTDITVLFALKKKESFRRHIEDRYAEAAAKRGARRRDLSYGGHAVVSAESADRRVSSFAVVLGDVAAVSNNFGSLKRIVDAASGGLPPLSAATDFLYMRTIFPEGDPAEDVFIYLSDPHIRRLVWPRWKIGEARRMRCASNLMVLSNARFWFRSERRRDPSMEELAADGYLMKTAPACPDGGAYSFDPGSGEPACSVHNRSGFLTPVGDIPLDEATAEEAALYEAFVANYNRYWSRFFDPIGIRVKLGDNIRVQTCILPLIENSWYDGLVALSGKTGGPLPEASVLPRTIASIRTRVSPEWREKTGVGWHLHERKNVSLDWLGDDVSLNLCDGKTLFTVGAGGVGVFGRGGRSVVEPLALGYLVSALNLPAYISVSVKDPVRAERAIPDLFQALWPERHSPGFSVETYALGSHRGKPVHAVTVTLFGIKVRLYAAVAGDRLVVATRRDVVSDLLDAAADADRKTVAETGNLELSLYRRAFREISPTVTLGYQEQIRQACRKNLALAEILLDTGSVPPGRLAEAAFAFRGYAPYCPSGGIYSLDPATGRAACSVHGAAARPRQPDAVDERSPTLKLVDSLEKVNARLAFTPEGLMATLEVQRGTSTGDSKAKPWWKFWK